MTTKKQQLIEEQQLAKEELVTMLEKAGNQVYTSLESVSASGMSRRIKCYIAIDNDIINIDWYIQKLGLYKIDQNKGGLKVSGCGSDMGFEVVYNLSSLLNRTEDGKYSHEGAYKLKQRWMN